MKQNVDCNSNKAFLFVFTDTSTWGRMAQISPPELMPVANRPFIEWILIRLVESGFNEIHVFVSEYAQEIMTFLGNGDKWGIRITFSAVIDEVHAMKRLQYEMLDCNGLLVDCCVCPVEFEFLPRSYETDVNLVWLEKDKIECGWAYLCNENRRTLFENKSYENVRDVISAIGALPETIKYNSKFISCGNSKELLKANYSILSSSDYKEFIPGNEIEDGVFIESGVVIHPIAKIESLTVVGENSNVGRGSCLQTNSCLGRNCVVGDMTTLKNVVILDNTIIGENLNFEDCIVAGDHLLRSGSDRDVIIPDRFIVGKAIRFDFSLVLFVVIKYIAVLLSLPVVIPLYIILYTLLKLSGISEPIVKKEVLLLPSEEIPELYRIFLYREFVEKDDKFITRIFKCRLLKRLPAFYNLFTNSMDWFGTAGRSVDEIYKMPDEWRRIYFKSRVGIFRLAEIDSIDSDNNMSVLASESFYVTNYSVGLDFKIFFRYLKRLFIIPCFKK